MSFHFYNQASDIDLLGGQFNIDGEVNLNSIVNSSQAPIYDVGGSYISLSANWKNKIRAVLTGRIKSAFENEGISAFDENFSIEEFITEAYIEIRNIGGSPVAVVVGKHPIAFGQNLEMMPFYEHNEVRNILSQREVFGVTIDLTEGLFGLFDRAEVSIFETQSGDLDFGYLDGVSVRLSKLIKDNWLLTFSHGEFRNTDSVIPGEYSYEWTGHERRTALGLVWQSNDGNIVGWVEGAHIQNNPQYPNANFVLTAGAKAAIHKTTDIVIEYNHIQNYLHSIALGSRTKLTPSLSLGVELRYRDYISNEEDEIILGVRLTKSFGTIAERRNTDYLFESDINEVAFRHQVLHKHRNRPAIIFSESSEAITKQDVLSYLEASFLDSKKRVELFKEAGNSYPHYLDLKSEWLEAKYERGLKELSYLHLLKKLANQTSNSQFFQTELQDFHKLKREYIDNILSPYLEKGIGIEKAKKEFIQTLVFQGYPVDSSASVEESFIKWSQLQEKKIYYSLFSDQAKAVETHFLVKYHQQLSQSSPDYISLERKSISDLKLYIDNKFLSELEIRQLFERYPHLEFSLESLELLTPNTMSYQDISKQDQEGVVTSKIDNVLFNKIRPSISSLKNKLLTFHNITKQFKENYTKEQLLKLSAQNKQSFLETKDFNTLVLAKLYKLATEDLINISEKKLKEQELSLIEHSLNFISSSKIKESSDILENSLYKELLSLNTDELPNKNYQKKLESFFSWVIKFEIKRAFANFKPFVRVKTLTSRSKEIQRRIDDYYFSKSKHDYEKHFYRNELAQSASEISVIYQEKDFYSGQDLVNWLFP